MINVFDLVAGERVELADGRKVLVEENMEDGMWVSVKEDDNPESELIHAQEILHVVKD